MSSVRKAFNRNIGHSTNDQVSQSFATLPTGSLEDWDVAVQKTETRLNRINEQRTKVRTRVTRLLTRTILLLLANVIMFCPIC